MNRNTVPVTVYPRTSMNLMDSLWQDLRHGIRTLANSPGFTIVGAIVFALGIGANTAIFSIVNAVLLNPFPFPESERLVAVEAHHVSGKNRGTGYPEFLDWKEQNTVFEEMAIQGWTSLHLLTGRGAPQRIAGTRVTPGFLRVLGINPVYGRFFTAEEDRPGAPPVAVLSYAVWQRLFGARPDVIGQAMAADGKQYTIIGVMPARFAFPGTRSCDFWEPLRDNPAGARGNHQYTALARLKPGITLQRAQADMTAIADRLELQHPETNKGWSVTVMPISEALAREARTPLAVLYCAVTFVLLLACANVAGLILARATGRAKEMAIRSALGAGRGRIVRQLLTESVLLAFAGGGLGLVFALWLVDLMRVAAPQESGLDAVLRIDSAVLAFTFAASMLTGLFTGLAPALYGSKPDVNTALKGEGPSWFGARSGGRFLSGLVAAEVALSLTLLVCASLLAKDLFLLLRTDIGVQTQHVLTFSMRLPPEKYDSARRTAFYEELLTRIRGIEGAVSAGAVDTLPMTGDYSGGPIEIEGRARPADREDLSAQFNSSSPGYFRTMGMPILLGRDFDGRDSKEAVPVAIIDQTFASRFFAGENPLGHRISYRGRRTVVGVVGSVRHQQPMHPPVSQIYTPYAQTGGDVWIALRAAGDPSSLSGAVRGAVRALDADALVENLRPMHQVVVDSLSEQSLVALFLAGFAGSALALAAIGIYGLIAYSVSLRLHEMGVRMALGASSRDVLSLVLHKGAALAGIGVAAGVPAALAASRLIGSLLYGVDPHDFGVFGVTAIVLIVVALIASYLPARRAAKVAPNEALRCE